jgi:hypothetical protein
MPWTTTMIALILLIAALVLFLLAAFNVPSRVNLGWLGMACLTVAALLGSHHVVGIM